MLTAEKISFTYPKAREPVFQDISLKIAQGEICAIIGKNGCGKTTLIKCITGIFTPQNGHVECVAPVGYVPQKVNLIFDMIALDAIVMGRYKHIGAFSLPQKSDYAIARESAEKLNISKLLDQHFSELSGGQQQLVLVARALASEPRCIIFDEPCAALDYGNQNKILSIIDKLRENKITTIFSTHDPNHVIRLADKVLVMQSARKFLFGRTNEMITDAVLSDVYGMKLKVVNVDDQVTSVVALFD